MRNKTKKRITKIIVGFTAVGFVLAFFVLRIWSSVSQKVVFVINPGDTVSSVSARLIEQKLVINDSVFKLAVKLNGGKIQSGEYDIPRGTSVWRIASMFSHGRVATVKIIIPEGLTIQQIKKQLKEDKGLSGDVDCDKSSAWGDVCDLAEGEIFPDTYRVARGTKRLAVLDLAYKKMKDVKSKLMAAHKKPPAPLRNWNEVLILASIVQKETPKTSEMRIVASVYLNRLRRGMRLQADPTVVYALTNGYGDMRGAPLLRDHLKTDSPYNTYRNDGLPPAPIANVGSYAIRAVLEPANTNYLFFVADGRGGHKFSVTYEEHMKNHSDWRKIKRQNNPEYEEAFK
ncbi:MAG: endolytic transglycosylase MltG [Alphaproteobacteria bacterium]|nr:endolytic transglycosylase MltG [Alphaproteobacteria bacterium]